MPSSGKRMADQESEFIAKIASGVSGLNAHAWDRLGEGDSLLALVRSFDIDVLAVRPFDDDRDAVTTGREARELERSLDDLLHRVHARAARKQQCGQP